MKLSIIICTYNRKKELERALDCVFGQKTDFTFEVVVGNDCSTDGTDEVLKTYKEKYNERLVVSTLEKNCGVGTNWAKAVMLAPREHLAFLDDDDYWTDDRRMQTMVDYLEAHPEVYRFPIQDWNTNILILRKAKCAYLDMPTCVLSYTSGSLSRPKSYEQVAEKYEREAVMTKYLADCFPDDPLISFSKADSDRYINHILTTLAYRRGDYKEAKHYSRLAGETALRDKCTRTRITFHLFRLAKRLRWSMAD